MSRARAKINKDDCAHFTTLIRYMLLGLLLRFGLPIYKVTYGSHLFTVSQPIRDPTTPCDLSLLELKLRAQTSLPSYSRNLLRSWPIYHLAPRWKISIRTARLFPDSYLSDADQLDPS